MDVKDMLSAESTCLGITIDENLHWKKYLIYKTQTKQSMF